MAGKGAKASSAGDRRGYSIRVASRLSGISPDKLRIWERRYGFPAPQRTASGLRVYSDEDVSRLALISRAMEAGYRAGDAIAAEPDELKRFVTDCVASNESTATAAIDPDALLRLLHDDRAEGVRDALRQAVAILGPKRFVTEVATPLLQAAGDAWHDGKIRIHHEHLLSAALSTQLRLLLAAYEQPRSGPVVLLTTLPEERHGLGLEMAALYLALGGFTIRMLGVDTPIAEIVEAALGLEVDVVGISVSASSAREAAAAALRALLIRLPQDVELWVGGETGVALALDDARVRRAVTWPDVDELMRSHAHRG